MVTLIFLVLEDAWAGCQGADVLLESPSAMAGVHIAEALSPSCFNAVKMLVLNDFYPRDPLFSNIHDALDKVCSLQDSFQNALRMILQDKSIPTHIP